MAVTTPLYGTGVVPSYQQKIQSADVTFLKYWTKLGEIKKEDITRDQDVQSIVIK